MPFVGRGQIAPDRSLRTAPNDANGGLVPITNTAPGHLARALLSH